MSRILLIILTFLVVSCSQGYIIDTSSFNKYRKVNLPESQVPPSQTFLMFLKPAVFVTSRNSGSSDFNTNLMQSFAVNEIKKSFNNQNIVRNITNMKSSNVISALETGNTFYLSKSVDYIISVRVDNIDISYSYVPQYSAGGGTNSQTYYAGNSFIVDVSMYIQIIKIPESAIVYSKVVSDRQQFSFKTFGNPSQSTILSHKKQAISSSAKRLINKSLSEVYFFFQGSGNVLERRIYGDKNIFKINLGYTSNLTSGSKVSFYQRTAISNWNGAKFIDEYIGSGTVTNKVYSNSAWVHMNNSLAADKVRKWGYVTIERGSTKY